MKSNNHAALEQLLKEIADVYDEMLGGQAQQTQARLQPLLARLEVIVRPYREELESYGIDTSQPDIDKQIRQLAKRSAEQRKAEEEQLIEELARRGWYLLEDMMAPQFMRMLDAVGRGETAALDEVMESYARTAVTSIRERCIAMFPHRAHILALAFDAHEQGIYALSIPAILSQAEGISNDIMKASVFSKEKEKPATAGKYEHKLAPFRKIMKRKPLSLDEHLEYNTLLFWLSPLNILQPVMLDVKEWSKQRLTDLSTSALNRHGVLHGYDVTYPTEGNGLRAIVLLGYLCMVKRMWERPDPSMSQKPARDPDTR